MEPLADFAWLDCTWRADRIEIEVTATSWWLGKPGLTEISLHAASRVKSEYMTPNDMQASQTGLASYMLTMKHGGDMARFVAVTAFTSVAGQLEEIWINLDEVRLIKRDGDGATIQLVDGTGLVITDSPEVLFSKVKFDA